MKYKAYFHKYKGTERYTSWTAVYDFSGWDRKRFYDAMTENTKDDPQFYVCLEVLR